MKKYLIANGNSTLLISGCPSGLKKELTDKYLDSYEQVGFISRSNNLPSLEMMGNELCVNATLAFASSLGKSGKLCTSGLTMPIEYFNSKNKTSIKLQINITRKGNIVILDGIGFILAQDSDKISKALLRRMAEKFKLPAFGAIKSNGYGINPVVYVGETNSMICETACGSGSIALNVLTNIERIMHPSGKVIEVKRKGNVFTVKANVVII